MRIFMALMALLMGLSGTGLTLEEEIAETLGVQAQTGEIVYADDSHAGFHGDGEALVILEFAEDDELVRSIEENIHWRALPMNEAERLLAYGPVVEGLLPEAENLLPDVEEGWYRLIDRHHLAGDEADAERMMERYSYNFTLGVYDAAWKRLYYVELDT